MRICTLNYRAVVNLIKVNLSKDLFILSVKITFLLTGTDNHKEV